MQAQWDAGRLNAACDNLAETAMDFAAEQQQQTGRVPSLGKQQILEQAQAAQQVNCRWLSTVNATLCVFMGHCSMQGSAQSKCHRSLYTVAFASSLKAVDHLKGYKSSATICCCCAPQAAEYADENVSIAALSATILYPCQHTATTAAAAASDSSKASGPGSTAAADPVNPYFNTRALQLWILRACQQLKGGLRDKPGKPADYYHSCYCLSGLSVAQHMPGGGVLGPDRNQLKKTHPVANIVVEKLQAARAYFGQLQA